MFVAVRRSDVVQIWMAWVAVSFTPLDRRFSTENLLSTRQQFIMCAFTIGLNTLAGLRAFPQQVLGMQAKTQLVLSDKVSALSCCFFLWTQQNFIVNAYPDTGAKELRMAVQLLRQKPKCLWMVSKNHFDASSGFDLLGETRISFVMCISLVAEPVMKC